ncbi:uncharacterized protein LOC120396363 isoform X4 [Mauremys reevesii]|uniref:uncharacterized protein LOC120396363 isoform X4 n=1 Tax=Mauremys reevesii TaxID=260615 RepID=UPI00193F2230|nr:uncharacterized protein LOC120396363 isoform X4 [Mauremys reevesii]
MFRRPPDTGHLRLSTGSSRLAKVQDLHTALSSTLRPPQGRRLSDTKRDILHLLARQHTKAAVSILLQMPWPYERPTSRVKLKDVRSRDRRCFTMSCRERHRLSVSSEPRPGEEPLWIFMAPSADCWSGLEVLAASSYMMVQVRRAAMFLPFQLISRFQVGSGRCWDNYMTHMLLYPEDHKTCFWNRE